VGCHPHNAADCTALTIDKLAKMASEKKVAAWGEIGLDYFRNRSPREKQMEIFETQLLIAEDLGLPVIIHDREAHDDILDALRKKGKGENKGVIHCYSGDLSLAMELIDMGYFISIPGTVTFKNATTIKDVAKSIPLERLMIETDAPFLAPVPKRGKRNEPLFVKFTAEEIARLRGKDIEVIAKTIEKNTKELFNIS
jgi:TatD DNase family protein